ncbi:MAG: HTH-type transcriptional regulator PgrR [Xylophilus sp.]|nr:MAG: HTH-type transcriptional regulator PgrR [Xylophilus sp.]
MSAIDPALALAPALDSLGGFAVFVQAAETRSFVAAGRALGVSASAVGKRIARLEQRLGVRLFHRSTRSIALTDAGALLLACSRRVLAEVEQAEAELSATTAVPGGRLRVSLPVVCSLVLPVLADFMRAYPDIVLDLDFTDRLVDVAEEGFDAVVRTGDPPDSGLLARLLGYFKWCIVAAPEYLAQRGYPGDSMDLMRHTCLHYRAPGTGRIERWPWRAGVAVPELPTALVCNNLETRVRFALRGRGIACVPDFAVRDALADGRLVTMLDHQVDAQPRAVRVL